jgi:hypothetical protein
LDKIKINCEGREQGTGRLTDKSFKEKGKVLARTRIGGLTKEREPALLLST